MDKENVTDLAETAFEILTSRELIHSSLKKEIVIIKKIIMRLVVDNKI